MLAAQCFQCKVHEEAEAWATRVLTHPLAVFAPVRVVALIWVHKHQGTGDLTWPVTMLQHLGGGVTAGRTAACSAGAGECCCADKGSTF